jgi:hypothetical protein
MSREILACSRCRIVFVQCCSQPCETTEKIIFQFLDSCLLGWPCELVSLLYAYYLPKNAFPDWISDHLSASLSFSCLCCKKEFHTNSKTIPPFRIRVSEDEDYTLSLALPKKMPTLTLNVYARSYNLLHLQESRLDGSNIHRKSVCFVCQKSCEKEIRLMLQ